MLGVRTIRFVSQTKPSKYIQRFIPLRSVLGSLSSSYCSGSVSKGFSYDSEHQISKPPLISKTTSSPTPQTSTQIGWSISKTGGQPLEEASMQKIFRLLKNNEVEGFFKPPGIIIYIAIIRVLCYWRMDKMLESLLLEVVKSKKEHLASDLFGALEDEFEDIEANVDVVNVEEEEGEAHALDAMVKAFVSVGMFDEAIRSLCSLSSCNLGKPLLSSCKFLMDRLVDGEKVDFALEFAQNLLQLDEEEPPYVHAYGILMKALFRKGNLEKAADVFRKTIRKTLNTGRALNNLPFTCIYVQELCSHGLPSQAEEIVRDMEEEHGLKPDKYCYEALIHGYCQSGDPIRALDLHSEMISKDIKTNSGIVSTILHCLCDVGMFAETVDQFKYFQDLGIHLDNSVYNIVIDALGKVGKYKEALKLLEEMKDGYKYLLTKRLKNFKRGGEPLEEARHVFGQLKKKENDGFFRPPDLRTYLAIIRILCYWRMDMKLDSLLLEVVKSKKQHLGFDVSDLFDKLDTHILNYSPYCPHNYLAAQVHDVMTKAFVRVSMFDEAIGYLCKVYSSESGKLLLPSCNFLMDRLVENGKVDWALYEAQELLDSGTNEYYEEQDRKPPRMHAYGILMKALFRKGNLEKASDVFRKTVKAGKAVYSLPFTSIYVEELCSHGLPSRAEDILRNMKKQHGLLPDENCYGALIHGYCEAGDPIRALSLWSEMRAKDIKTSNYLIAFTVLDCLHKFGMFHQGKCLEELSIYLDKSVSDALRLLSQG